MVCRNKLSKIGRGSAVGKQMSQPVGSGVDYVTSILLFADVDHRQLATLVSGVDQSFQSFMVERRTMAAVGAGVIDDNLDVIRTLGDAGVNPCLCLGWRCKGWDLDAIFGAVPAWYGGQRTGRAEIGLVEILAICLCLFHLLHVLRVGEHIEFGGDAEDLSLFKCAAPGMRVRIDESG